jgi:hypothetical protein
MSDAKTASGLGSGRALALARTECPSCRQYVGGPSRATTVHAVDITTFTRSLGRAHAAGLPLDGALPLDDTLSSGTPTALPGDFVVCFSCSTVLRILPGDGLEEATPRDVIDAIGMRGLDAIVTVVRLTRRLIEERRRRPPEPDEPSN